MGETIEQLLDMGIILQSRTLTLRKFLKDEYFVFITRTNRKLYLGTSLEEARSIFFDPLNESNEKPKRGIGKQTIVQNGMEVLSKRQNKEDE